jgi:L-amino acid N-acyltransferase YncA
MPARKIAIFSSRRATPEDSGAIARIYNEGIADRVATFETRLRSAEDVRAWFDGVHPVVVVERDGDILAFAATFSYRPRECYWVLKNTHEHLPDWEGLIS